MGVVGAPVALQSIGGDGASSELGKTWDPLRVVERGPSQEGI